MNPDPTALASTPPTHPALIFKKLGGGAIVCLSYCFMSVTKTVYKIARLVGGLLTASEGQSASMYGAEHSCTGGTPLQQSQLTSHLPETARLGLLKPPSPPLVTELL